VTAGLLTVRHLDTRPAARGDLIRNSDLCGRVRAATAPRPRPRARAHAPVTVTVAATVTCQWPGHVGQNHAAPGRRLGNVTPGVTVDFENLSIKFKFAAAVILPEEVSRPLWPHHVLIQV
jgi:hypothetical protein